MHPITIQIPEWPEPGQTTQFNVNGCAPGSDKKTTLWSRDVFRQGAMIRIPIAVSNTEVTTVEMVQEMARADLSFATETLRALGWDEIDLYYLVDTVSRG